MATTKTTVAKTAAKTPAVIDDESLFYININDRTITHETNDKLLLIQGDANSERYSFEVPRTIEGHKVDHCTEIEVHYINIGSDATEKSAGVYTVDDMNISEDGNSVIFSWLISHGATKFVGTMSFAIRFIRRSTTTIEGEETRIIDYSWSTLPYTGIIVSAGIDAGGIITTEFVDILYEWYDSLIGDTRSVKNQCIEEINAHTLTKLEDLNNAKQTAIEDLKEEVLEHSYNFTKTIVTTDGSYLHFFVGTEEEYNALPDDKKVNTFAILTDDKSAEEVSMMLEQLVTRLANGDMTVAVANKANTANKADEATAADTAKAVYAHDNSKLLKLFVGTTAEYNALADKSNIFPYITDVAEPKLYHHKVAIHIQLYSGADTSYVTNNYLSFNFEFTSKDNSLTDEVLRKLIFTKDGQGAYFGNVGRLTTRSKTGDVFTDYKAKLLYKYELIKNKPNISSRDQDGDGYYDMQKVTYTYVDTDDDRNHVLIEDVGYILMSDMVVSKAHITTNELY